MQLLLAILPFTVLLLAVLWLTDGHFTYSLDDPYIHLALARNIWHGHYGINPGEWAAPSSSIAWPFLLAPFSAMGAAFEYMPLLLNTLCLCVFVAALDAMFADVAWAPRLGAIALIALASNVYGLVFTGMEHSLQITLVALIMLPYCASADAPARPGGVRAELPAYAYAALLALPLVRYEGLAISVPLLLLSAYRGAWRKSGCALAAIGLAVAGFSLFLHSKGLGWLPSSILRKAGPVSVHSLLQNAWNNFAADIFLAPLVVCLLVYYWRRDRAWFGAILLATVLQYCLGSNGWFGRYEAYFVLFAVLLATRAVLCAGRALFPYMLALPFFFPYLAIYTLLTPLGSSNIYNQQAQMAALAIAVGEPVAVNDLGLVSLRSPYYVLDLWGLGSMQALQHHLKGDGPAWMSALMARKQVRYAFVYDAWIAPRPAGWIRVGSLLLQQPRVLLSSPVVALYAVDAESAVKLRQVLSEAARRNTSRARSISVN